MSSLTGQTLAAKDEQLIGPLKNFAVLLSHESVGNFAALHGPPILADVVKAIS